MPRVDTLLNANRTDEFFLKYPQLKGKNYAYMHLLLEETLLMDLKSSLLILQK